MSRGFVKEEDQEEAPVIPPRAALPDGVTNYVTTKGYQALLNEKDKLKKERKDLPEDNETEHRRAAMVIDGKLNLLHERIKSARIIDFKKQPQDEVRFGAIVEFKNQMGKQKFQIVGVDEADIKQKKIAFTAPIARALAGKKEGEIVEFSRGKNTQKLEIIHIGYPK